MAGILPVLTVPTGSFTSPGGLLERGRYVLGCFQWTGEKGDKVPTNEKRQAALHARNHAAGELERARGRFSGAGKPTPRMKTRHACAAVVTKDAKPRLG